MPETLCRESRGSSRNLAQLVKFAQSPVCICPSNSAIKTVIIYRKRGVCVQTATPVRLDLNRECGVALNYILCCIVQGMKYPGLICFRDQERALVLCVVAGTSRPLNSRRREGDAGIETYEDRTDYFRSPFLLEHGSVWNS